ncbi:MAG: TRAP transporter large permease subunit, partial [Acetobacteraceae bacterium]
MTHTTGAVRRTGTFWLGELDKLIDLACEVAAAALVLIEIGILFAGVVWRYALDNPLVWSGELAEVLFLWLVSLGAVIALRRSEHMRMTVFISRVSPRMQRALARGSALVIAIFTCVLVVPGITYMEQQQAITMPTLQIPGSWEIAGELAALAILLFTAIRQFIAGPTWRELAVTLGIGLAIGVALWLLEPWLQDIGNADLLIFFVAMVGVCIICGVPIAFGFGISTAAYIFYTSSIPLSIIISQMNQGMASIELLAVPMFVVLGLLLEMSGIARALVDCLSALVGNRRGGLSYSLIGAMYLVAGISGSKAADQAAIAPVLLPEMKRRGAHPGE